MGVPVFKSTRALRLSSNSRVVPGMRASSSLLRAAFPAPAASMNFARASTNAADTLPFFPLNAASPASAIRWLRSFASSFIISFSDSDAGISTRPSFFSGDAFVGSATGLSGPLGFAVVAGSGTRPPPPLGLAGCAAGLGAGGRSLTSNVPCASMYAVGSSSAPLLEK